MVRLGSLLAATDFVPPDGGVTGAGGLGQRPRLGGATRPKPSLQAGTIRAGCAATTRSPAGAATTAGRLMRRWARSKPSLQAPGRRAGYAATTRSPAGAKTAKSRFMRRRARSKPSPQATNIRAGYVPTTRSPAGATTRVCWAGSESRHRALQPVRADSGVFGRSESHTAVKNLGLGGPGVPPDRTRLGAENPLDCSPEGSRLLPDRRSLPTRFYLTVVGLDGIGRFLDRKRR